MSEFHFIIDESKFHYQKNGVQGTICSICCIVIDDLETLQGMLSALYRELGFTIGFGVTKSEYPHYTEDAIHQKSDILSKISKLPFKAFVSFINIEGRIDDSNFIHKILLIETIKPVIRNYQSNYKMSSVHIYFEELEGLKKTIESLDLNTVIKIPCTVDIISKSDYNGISCIPDYTLGALNDLLKGDVNNGRSFGDKVFTMISPRVS